MCKAIIKVGKISGKTGYKMLKGGKIRGLGFIGFFLFLFLWFKWFFFFSFFFFGYKFVIVGGIIGFGCYFIMT